jgi:hypothetical protein
MEASEHSRSVSVEQGTTNSADEQKEHLKEFVVECIIKRYTPEESLTYIKDKLGVEVGAHDYNRIRGELKRELGKNLKHLQRDRYAYGREHFKRIEEIRLIQKKLWKLIDENPDRPILQKSCLSELYQSTMTLANLYESINNLDQRDSLDQKDKGLEEEPERITNRSNIKSPPSPSPPADTTTSTPPADTTTSTPPADTTTPTPPADTTTSTPPADTTTPTPPADTTTPTPPAPEEEVKAHPSRIIRYTSNGKPVTIEN